MRSSLIIICLIASVLGTGQTTDSSPYTRFGLGTLGGAGLATSLGMGGFGAAYAPTGQLNLINPATYALLINHKPVFNLGARYKYLQLESSEAKDEIINAGLSNVSFGFPIGERAGFGFGMQPYTNVGYKIVNEQTITGIGNVEYQYNGKGGLNRIYLGGAYQVINNESSLLSLGVTGSYLTGTISNVGRTIFPLSGGYFNTRVENSLIVNDFKFDLGLYYKGKIKDNLYVHTGVVFGTSSKLNARKDLLAVSYIRYGQFAEITVDTAEYVDSIRGYIRLPSSLNYSLALDFRPGQQQLLVGLDYKVQDWSKYEEVFDDVTTTDLLKNSYQFSVGLQYSPIRDKEANCDLDFFQMMDYRLGFRYNSTYIQLDETELNELGISFGLGLPVSSCNSAAMINIGAEFGERGTLDNNLIRERFASVYLGLSLSPWRGDSWFIKRKYD